MDLNKFWIRLVIIGIVLVVAVVAWDMFLLYSGAKDEFNYSILPINTELYGPVEEHLRDDASFSDFEREAVQLGL